MRLRNEMNLIDVIMQMICAKICGNATLASMTNLHSLEKANSVLETFGQRRKLNLLYRRLVKGFS
jgi:hypothetical protein